MNSHLSRRATALSFALLSALFLAAPASAATTGLVFEGGCPQGTAGLCSGGSNAVEENVAALLGLDVADVRKITTGFTIDGFGSGSGSWSVSDPEITHLAFKSDEHFILGRLTATSGDWMNDTSAPGSWDITLVDCPAVICGVERAYSNADFRDDFGKVAPLFNVRGFAVVPVPAAVWLFGSALGFLVWSRRKASA